jgi:hypothetical protein
VRISIALLVVLAAVAASLATAATVPIYTVSFTGTGSEHQIDDQQNIYDDGTCNAAEHVDVTATLSWSTSWPGFKTAARTFLARPALITGSAINGTHVKDACGLPLTDAPPGWVSQESCSAALVAAGSPQLSLVKKTKTAVVLSIVAPPFSVPIGIPCSLNVRNDQLAGHLVVPLKKLQALKKKGSLAFAVGTARPGPGDLYSPTLNCSQPTKPYEGYRTADHCEDTLSWSGTVQIKRV